MANKSSDSTDTKDEDKAQTKQSSINRRSVFSILGVGALVSACGESKFGGINKLAKKKRGDSIEDSGATDGDNPEGEDGLDGLDFGEDGDGGGLGDGNSDSCHASRAQSVDLEKFKPAKAVLTPAVKIYGKNAGAHDTVMVALQFQDIKQIKHIIITTEDGRMRAVHAVNANDDNNNIVIIDNLFLKGESAIQVLVQGAERFKSTHALEFFNSYKGMPVVDLGMEAFKLHQSVPKLLPSPMKKNDNIQYPDISGAPGMRPLFTAQADTKWATSTAGGGTGFLGDITDIMGNQLVISGDILFKHQTFCTYQTSGGKVYRTIMRIG